jgi:hypothetical protein
VVGGWSACLVEADQDVGLPCLRWLLGYGRFDQCVGASG